MKKITNLTNLVVHESATFSHVLDTITKNKLGFVISVDHRNCITGVITDGDVRRAILKTNTLPMDAKHVANTKYRSVHNSATSDEVQSLLDDSHKFLPIVDSENHVLGIWMASDSGMQIGNCSIGSGHPTFIIAEIGNNHNGDFERAKKLIDLAKGAGADCAKFQMRDLKNLYVSGGDASAANQDLGAQYTLDLLSKFSLSNSEMLRAFDYCHSQGITPLCTPWDESSLEILEEYGMAGYKVASADFTNFEFLKALASTNKPIICSSGMSTEAEFIDSVNFLDKVQANYAVLHCNSTYPAPYKDINLSYLAKMKRTLDCPIGYSGHERGWHIPVAAVAMGANIIEKHFTLDKKLEGNDHKVSLLPDEFKRMVQEIRDVESSLGTEDSRIVTQGELINREVLAKSLHARSDLEIGHVVERSDIAIMSPGQGLQPNKINTLIGKKVNRKIIEGTPFFDSDISGETIMPRNYVFRRPFGVPVRYHDSAQISKCSNFDLIEYHLSYKDLDEELADWFNKPIDFELVVHSPELFENDHILDLASPDDSYRKKSLQEMQRVIDVTRELKKWHPMSKSPCIVTNVGGFSADNFLTEKERKERYEILKSSFSELDDSGVSIIPQTMPPFPWHFGGQRYHNLFLRADEIRDMCKILDVGICLDISHSQLACNYNGWSMEDFLAVVGPFVKHIHIVDARGNDGEGLQIGDGEIDFHKMGMNLDKYCPGIGFIPEIWQGHKNGGEGFWIALDRLEKKI